MSSHSPPGSCARPVLARCLALCLALAATSAASAQEEPGALLEVRYRAAPRAQIAIWVEDADGNYLSTVRLTEATAYRGIGNRPGASQMNSGYRWPYGRREGVLPHWAYKRRQAPLASPFNRVIFQARVEGYASRTTSDQSTDQYFCLSFNQAASQREALDAVTCASASKFQSDKGRYLTQADVDNGYAEPYEPLGGGAGIMQPLPLLSGYPPRIDHSPCFDANDDNRDDDDGSSCFDHIDATDFAAHVREVMPNIDVVTMATPEGGVARSELFTVPTHWPQGDYRLVAEVNVEGDYSGTHDADAYPTATSPASGWDSWATGYGYPYRGQPSVVYQLPFSLGVAGEITYETDAPVGATSWDHWGDEYGAIGPLDGITDDAQGAPGKGADRLIADGGGARLSLEVRVYEEAPDPEDVPEPKEMAPDQQIDGDRPPGEEGPGVIPMDGEGGGGEPGDDGGEGVIMSGGDGDGTGGDGDTGSPPEVTGPVGWIPGLALEHHRDRYHAHDWIVMRFRTPESDRPLHHYEVRVSGSPIESLADFMQDGRPARAATESAEGATALELPIDLPPGEEIEAEVGDLRELTEYHIGVRAVDELNRPGPISVAKITTLEQKFVTVPPTPCFVATVAYGSPFASEIGVLRRFRDRVLLPNALGRALVDAYYARGPALAGWIRERPRFRAAARAALTPIVQVLRLFDEA